MIQRANKSLIILVWITLSGLLLGNGILQGVIYDQEHEKPIPGVEVSVATMDIGAITDDQGRFRLKVLSAKELAVNISHIGYADQRLEIKAPFTGELEIYLEPIVLRGNEIQVIGTRSTRSLLQVPGRVAVLELDALALNQQNTIDFALQSVPGINIHRTSGNYEIRPVISMRGVGGADPGRTLVLIDGVPINKTDTGVANLKRVRMPEVARIEVLKGAGSSLYGASAMGGVINILTRDAKPGFGGYLDLNSGTYDSWNADLGIKQHYRNGIKLALGIYSGSSDGYYDLSASLRDDYSVPLFLEERGANARLSWTYSPALGITIDYGYDHDVRGEGYRIEHELGNHRAFDTRSLRIHAQGGFKKWHYELTTYRQHEDYLRISESFKGGSYSRFDVKSNRDDNGINGLFNRTLSGHHLLSIGFDAHRGQVAGGDYYTTSPDTILNQGIMDFQALYLQDEVSWLNGRLRILTSLRLDQVQFHNGLFQANNPSNALYDFNEKLTDHNWTAWSPRLGIRYVHTSKIGAYASVSRGFRAAPLDDLTRTGFMRLGFKLANPELGPETLTNVEFGLDIAPNPSLSIAPSIYYSSGNDFLYYVATGDSLWGRRPIYQRENVTQVDIRGAELAVAYRAHPTLLLKWYMAANRSRIAAFNARPELEGNDLTLSPRRQSGLSLQWQPGATIVVLDVLCKGSQYTDDENGTELPAYRLLNVRFSQNLWQHVQLGITIENLTDERYLEDLERRSPGRLLQIQAGYRW